MMSESAAFPYIFSRVPDTNTLDSIKKAYRRKALELHPDRNFGDTERTTKLFAEVQSAYEVLSDPQERAWYDSHEDAILRDMEAGTGAAADDPAKYEHSVGLTTADDITRLFRKFNGNVDFSDAPSGFFGFLRDTFDTLTKEEENAAMKEGKDSPHFPAFGHRQDNYEDVVKTFYAAWSGFSTSKSFSWRDRYRLSDADDRRMRRLMEKENKRFRGEAIQEFNDAVRSLVAFVRKRDPRYKPNTQTEAERQQVLRDVAAAQAARTRAANAAKLQPQNIPEWVKHREPDEEEIEEEEESDEEHFECVACRKTFKSENQFQSHEKSKKHSKAVQALRRKLQKEGKDLDFVDSTDTSDQQPRDDTALKDGRPGSGSVSQEEQKSEECAKVNGQEHIAEGSDQGVLADSVAEVNLADKVEWDGASNSTSEISEEGLSIEEQSIVEQPNPEAATPSSGNHCAKDTENNELGPKMGKAAQKRAKKAAKQSTTESTDSHIRCAVCNASFSSRTRMFQHVKDFGHAAPLQKPVKSSKSMKK